MGICSFGNCNRRASRTDKKRCGLKALRCLPGRARIAQAGKNDLPKVGVSGTRRGVKMGCGQGSGASPEEPGQEIWLRDLARGPVQGVWSGGLVKDALKGLLPGGERYAKGLAEELAGEARVGWAASRPGKLGGGDGDERWKAGAGGLGPAGKELPGKVEPGGCSRAGEVIDAAPVRGECGERTFKVGL
jgi:hypothetical protein